METLNSPTSFQLSNQKKFANLKLSNNKNIIRKQLKITPLSPKIRNSNPPINFFSPKKNESKNLSFFNTSEKRIKSSKSGFFKIEKKNSINDFDSFQKENNLSKLNLNKYSLSNKNSPIHMRKKEKNTIKFIKNYPKTFYQKIYNSIQKMKIHTDKTIKAMRKNMKISDKELFHRTTNVINIHNIYNKKLKKKKTNKEDNSDIDNEEETILDYSLLAKKDKKMDKTFKISPFSDRNGGKYSIDNENDNNNNYFYKYKNNIKLLGLTKIPLISFNKIKNKPFYIPLFKNIELNRNFYKNMYHYRSFDINDKILQNNANKIYDLPNALLGLNSYEKEPEIQLKYIFNKIKLIQDNIKYFKSNYMIKKNFRLAFISMENPIKAIFNYFLEELCVILIRIIPQLLKSFYNSLDQLLFIKIPGIDDEMQKKPSNEIECLKFNISFFNKVTDYFSACVDIFNVIQKQIAEFQYTNNEFQPLNNNLDLARYNCTRLISMADSYIEKYKNDENVLKKFEIGLNLKKKKYKDIQIDDFERFHKRRKIKFNNDIIKIDRINSALNIDAKGKKKDIAVNEDKNKINKNPSILNSTLIKEMMKYFEKNIKAKIISQQVIERFKTKELKKLRNIEEKNNNINECN